MQGPENLRSQIVAHRRRGAELGILLPPSVPGALVNLAALLMGRVPVNLNYTTSSQVLASCAEQCKLQTIIASKAFMERVHLELPTGKLDLRRLKEIALAGIG